MQTEESCTKELRNEKHIHNVRAWATFPRGTVGQ